MQGLQGSLSCWDGISKAEGVDLLAVDFSTVLKHTLNLEVPSRASGFWKQDNPKTKARCNDA